MENGPFEDVFPCISYKKNELSIAMLVYRRVNISKWNTWRIESNPPSNPAVKDTSNAVVAVDVARRSCGALAGRKHVPGDIRGDSLRQNLQNSHLENSSWTPPNGGLEV